MSVAEICSGVNSTRFDALVPLSPATHMPPEDVAAGTLVIVKVSPVLAVSASLATSVIMLLVTVLIVN